MELRKNKPFIISLLINGILIGIPLLLYAYFSYKGVLPSESEWKGNHGPWRMSWVRGFIYYPLLALMAFVPLNFILGIVVYIKTRSKVDILKGLGLSVISALLVYIHMFTVYWTVD